MTTTPLKNKKDLSGINNLKDLHREIARTKVRVKQQEENIKVLARRMPEAAMFAAVNGAVHVAVKKGVPTNIFNLVRNGIGLMVNINRQKKGIQGLISQGKELVVYTAFNQLLKFYQQRRNHARLTSEYKS
jgi:hypothetical protein